MQTGDDAPTAADRWATAVTAWSRMPSLRPAPVAGARAREWAREVLPPVGGTVLDVGCRDGSAAVALCPPATEIVGVDERGARLDEFVAAASARQIARRTLHGSWPDVAAIAPVADVVTCHHLVDRVDELVPFATLLTARARLAVVVEMLARAPLAALDAVARELGSTVVHRDVAPVTADDAVAVLREAGFDPEVRNERRAPDTASLPAASAPAVARWLGLSDDRVDEVAAALDRWFGEHGWEIAVLRWPGAADALD